MYSALSLLLTRPSIRVCCGFRSDVTLSPGWLHEERLSPRCGLGTSWGRALEALEDDGDTGMKEGGLWVWQRVIFAATEHWWPGAREPHGRPAGNWRGTLKAVCSPNAPPCHSLVSLSLFLSHCVIFLPFFAYNAPRLWPEREHWHWKHHNQAHNCTHPSKGEDRTVSAWEERRLTNKSIITQAGHSN